MKGGDWNEGLFVVVDVVVVRVKMLKILEKCIMVEYCKLCFLKKRNDVFEWCWVWEEVCLNGVEIVGVGDWEREREREKRGWSWGGG